LKTKDLLRFFAARK